MALTIATEQASGNACVSVSGEVDVSCADELRDALRAVLSGDAKRIAVDLGDVPYIDSTGIGVLVGAAHRAADEGRALYVTHPQRNVKRVLIMLGLDKDLGIDSAQAGGE